MAKQYKYSVQGRGDFPFDMLRYDRVYPLTEPVPSQHVSPRREAWTAVRSVEVEGEGCTPDRWASFGWSVVDPDNAVWGR